MNINNMEVLLNEIDAETKENHREHEFNKLALFLIHV